ncbi:MULTISPECIES: hypothetical protein [unclassified Rhizobium]|uniref:hypothetical protein n=1 Tax=unclassified Rhizobium TaxID=2613769 RepID=UPI0007EA6E05|nr:MULTISPECIES: hypothetical protein [unclassified Rhizobium]ANK83729.1 hypothetical protein AMK02_CH00069 [Rhizobium sp. N731]ANL13977.1 hypothetical protein AMJ97_CH00069 [Rhizobium sp. N1314]
MFKNRAAAQPKGWSPFHLAMLAGGATLLAIGATACAVVDDDMAAIAKKNVAVVETTPVSKTYTYPENRTARPAAARARIVAYHGSAPYICSPSGFGQKSRCFARPSI